MKVGTIVDGWCAPCKLKVTHTIEVMVEKKIKRVHCNTCGAQHAYRASIPGTRAASNRAGGRLDEPSNRPNQYQSLLRGRTASAARAYSNSAGLKVGELVSHTVFGLGAVTGQRDNKIDVLFPDGPRVLQQGG
jgi:hypothetical protein